MNFWTKWSRSRQQRTGEYYRKGPGFTQNGHSPKELSQKEQNHRAWRAHKQFSRDKQRHGSIQDGCPPWLKRQCNKEYRQWVRECIDNERYDLLGSKCRKDYFDPWRWD